MDERERFEKWWQEEKWGEMTLTGAGLKLAALDAWQAALSARKNAGYLAINANGEPYKAFRSHQEEQAKQLIKFLNEEDIFGSPFRVVPLFYEDQ
jgi:hypothetical protein